MLLQGASAVAKALGMEGFSFSINAELYTQAQNGINAITKLLFDPEEVKAEGEKSIAEARAIWQKLENEQAGFILTQRGLNENKTTSTKSSSTTSTKSADKSTTEKKDPLDAINPATGNTYKSELESMKAAQAAQIQAKLDQLNLEDQINSQAYEREKEWSDKKKAIAEAEKELNQQKIQERYEMLDNLAYIFGAESDLGKAALIAKQVLAAKELALEISKTITFAATTEAKAAASIAAGTAETAKIGFPQNIPMLIGYAAQAAAIIMSVKSAVGKVKGAAKIGAGSSISGGVGGSVGSVPRPQFNVAGDAGVNQIASTLANQPPVKAYVVGKEVSTQQSLDRNIVKNATLG